MTKSKIIFLIGFLVVSGFGVAMENQPPASKDKDQILYRPAPQFYPSGNLQQLKEIITKKSTVNEAFIKYSDDEYSEGEEVPAQISVETWVATPGNFAEIESRSKARLKELEKKDAFSIARKEQNKGMHRYLDILTYDKNTVGIGDNEYFHASFVDPEKIVELAMPLDDPNDKIIYVGRNDYLNDYTAKDRVVKPAWPYGFIATQAPMDPEDHDYLKEKQNTVADFWQMIWEKKAPVIVMLTDYRELKKKKKLEEGEKDKMEAVSKAERYFPTRQGESTTYCYKWNCPPVIVTNMKKDSLPFADRTLLKLTMNNEEHFVFHLHYRKWKDDAGVPVKDIRKLIVEMKNCLEKDNLYEILSEAKAEIEREEKAEMKRKAEIAMKRANVSIEPAKAADEVSKKDGDVEIANNVLENAKEAKPADEVSKKDGDVEIANNVLENAREAKIADEVSKKDGDVEIANNILENAKEAKPADEVSKKDGDVEIANNVLENAREAKTADEISGDDGKVKEIHRAIPYIVVHCTAGVGRTGAFILMDLANTLFEKRQEGNLPDLPTQVLRLREELDSGVRTFAQLKSVERYIRLLWGKYNK